jgi:drug/metabolite transporter (DMT)-like permease
VKSHTQRPSIPPVLVLSIGILAVSTASIFVRYAQENVPSLVIAAWRLSLATIVIAPFAYTRQRNELLGLRRRELLLALLSGFFLALHFATWITSLEYTSVTSSVILVTTTPLWVALFSPFTIKEPISRLILIGMLLALVGGIIIGLSDTCVMVGMHLTCPSMGEFLRGQAFLGDLLALIGAIMAAAYVLIGRQLRGNMSLLGYIFLVYGMAAAVLIGIVLASGQPAFGYPPSAYVWLLLLALIPQLLGHSSFNWALRYLSAAYVSITLLGEPIGSTILAYFLLGETPTALKIFGAILILLGIFIASQSEIQKTDAR